MKKDINKKDDENSNFITDADIDKLNVDSVYESYKEKLNGITEVKNYKEMCRLLDEHFNTNSNSKHKQFVEWSKYFSFKKKGQKFVDVHPLSQKERNETVQQEIMENSLYYLLYSNLLSYYEKYNRKSFSVTINDLALLLGFFNSEYRYNINKKHEFAYNLESKILENTDPDLIGFQLTVKNARENISKKEPTKYVLSETYDFYDHVSGVFKTQIENLLKNIIKSGTMLKEKRMFGNFVYTTYTETVSKNNYGDEISSLVPTFSSQERELNYKEKEKYIEIVNSVLKKFNCNSIVEIFNNNLQYKYYSELKLSLKNNMNLNYAYSVYTLYFSPERVQINRDSLFLTLFDNNMNFINKIKENKRLRMESKNNPSTYTPKIQSYIFDNICDELLNVYDEKEISFDRDWVFKRSVQRTIILENQSNKENNQNNEN